MSCGRTERALTARAIALAAVVLCLPGTVAAGPAAPPANRARPTRADLEAARRKVGRLEAEQALGATRRPYLVIDLETRILSYRMMGMTLREIPLDGVRARGLLPATVAAEPDAARVAGIFLLREKSGDPRLKPLTPEQIESGLDDENVADALPPDPPRSFTLGFRQPAAVRFEPGSGRAGIGAAIAGVSGRIARLFGWGGAHDTRDQKLVLTLRVDAAIAAEIYRSVIPGSRFLILPPPGLRLPDAGQEAPRAIRPAAPAPRPTPRPVSPLPPPQGVPFQIPPPVPTDPGVVPPVEPFPPDGEPSAVPGDDEPPAPGAGATPIPGSEEAPIPAVRIPGPETGPPAGPATSPPPVPAAGPTPTPTAD